MDLVNQRDCILYDCGLNVKLHNSLGCLHSWLPASSAVLENCEIFLRKSFAGGSESLGGGP